MGIEKLTCEAIAQAALGEPVKREGQELHYRCPQPERHANGDAHPSLKVNAAKDIWACFVCRVGGTAWQLAAFLAGLDAGDKRGITAFLRKHGLLNGHNGKGTPHTASPSASKRRRVGDFYYSPGLRKVRIEPGSDGRPKTFSWEHLDGDTWIPCHDCKHDIPLYVNVRFRELRDRGDLGIVLGFEGEAKADLAGKLSYAAFSYKELTTPEQCRPLSGWDVILWRDKDISGATQCNIAARILQESQQPRLIRVITPPAELPDRGDIVDAVRTLGWGTPEIDILITQAKECEPLRPQAGAEIMNSIFRSIQRFVSLSEPQARVVALWVVHSHAIDAADCTPYLSISSAEKQSGKTRLLEVLQLLVREPWLTGRATAAVLPRKIDAERPTLLLDESDAAFGGEKEYAETLRGILNTGYRRGGKTTCCVGQGANISVKDFETFCPKAIAGIGKLPDTVADRSMPIQLRRAMRGTVERFRRREIESEAGDIAAASALWANANIQTLRAARPVIPSDLSDRQAECCEPLLAIADLAGGEWPETARQALVELAGQARAADESKGVRLLADVRSIFSERGIDRIWSEDLAEALAGIEGSPWGEWSKGKPLTKNKLARLLNPFEVFSDSVRIGDRTSKGYLLSDFQDTFSRYLPDSKRNNGTSRLNIGENHDFQNGTERPCSVSENTPDPSRNAASSDVPFGKHTPAKDTAEGGVNSHGPPTRPCSHCNETGKCSCPLCRHQGHCLVCGGTGRVATKRSGNPTSAGAAND